MFAKRANNTLIQGFDMILLFFADLRLRLDDVPELKDVIMDLVH